MNQLILPALRCHMGDRVYYVTSMRMADVAARVTTAAAVTDSEDLDEQLQRELKARTKQITSYLLTQSERFFSAIVVAVKGGDPKWLELDIEATEIFDLDKIDADTRDRLTETVGFLGLSGEEQLFVLDGQHRLVGIKGALESKKGLFESLESLPKEEISVILVAHSDDEKGRIRTRRLFTTLNKEATKPTRAEIIVLDEDNAAALVTRKLRKEHVLLSGTRVAKSLKSTIAPSDKESFTTLDAIYDICFTLLKDRTISGVKWTTRTIERTRPTEAALAEMYGISASFWSELNTSVADVKDFSKKNSKKKPGDFRSVKGGNLVFRPAGVHTFSLAVRALLDIGVSMSDAVSELSKVNLQLNSAFYDGVLWNSVNGSMIVKQRNRALAARIMLYQCGRETDLVSLRTEYEEVRGIEGIELPKVG